MPRKPGAYRIQLSTTVRTQWLAPLELREVITELAGDLYAARDWVIGEYSRDRELNERIWRKYPGC